VGFGTSGKILSDPYPLGGYQGFEISASFESIPTDDLSRLGSKLTTSQTEAVLPKFTVGKGLYNDVDVYVSFTPYNREDQLSQFGGSIRWGFHQASLLPIASSIVTHFTSGNISNQLSIQTYGLDFISGISVGSVSLYAGAGFLETRGHFLGGPAGVTVSKALETDTVNGLHSAIGAHLRISSFFASAQIDRYEEPVISGKIGVRF
jgi:hypothetical protein